MQKRLREEGSRTLYEFPSGHSYGVSAYHLTCSSYECGTCDGADCSSCKPIQRWVQREEQDPEKSAYRKFVASLPTRRVTVAYYCSSCRKVWKESEERVTRMSILWVKDFHVETLRCDSCREKAMVVNYPKAKPARHISELL